MTVEDYPLRGNRCPRCSEALRRGCRELHGRFDRIDRAIRGIHRYVLDQLEDEQRLSGTLAEQRQAIEEAYEAQRKRRTA